MPTSYIETRDRCAVLLATDEGFALPTIASALQVRRHCVAKGVGIHVVMIDVNQDAVLQARDYLSADDIEINIMPKSMFLDFNQGLYNPTHVPMTALARFFLLDVIGRKYDRILYIDGDTWAQGDLSPLLNAYMPPDHFAAAEDRSYFYQNEIGSTGRRIQSYFSGLGIDGAQGYFNSGVLLADTDAYEKLCKSAFAFFRSNTASCMYHDQSALNAVASGRRLRLAPRWNFLSAYDEWGIHVSSTSCIRHFAGGEKPWLFPGEPFTPVFEEAFAMLSGLPLKVKRFSPQQLGQAMSAQKWRRVKSQTIFRHRLRNRKKMFNFIEETAFVR